MSVNSKHTKLKRPQKFAWEPDHLFENMERIRRALHNDVISDAEALTDAMIVFSRLEAAKRAEMRRFRVSGVHPVDPQLGVE